MSEQHAYNAAGVYSPTVTLTGAGGSTTQSLNVTVQAATFTITALNSSTTQEPISSMTPNTTPATFRITRTGGMSSGNTIRFTLAGTASPSDYTLATADPWNSWALTPPNGSTPGYIQFMSGPQTIDLIVTPNYGPEVEGDETVILTLLDLDDPTYDISGIPSAEVTITDSPPPTFTVTKTGTDSNGHLTEGSMLTLDISSDATIDRYEIVWDYDPTTQTGSPPEIAYTYGQSGTTLTHTYTDDNPTNTPSDNIQIRVTAFQGTLAHQLAPVALTIDNVAPTLSNVRLADSGGSALTTVYPNDSVSLLADLADVSMADTLSYEIQWGDGSVTGTATTMATVAAQHQYAAPGAYTVVLKVRDDDMAEGQFVTWSQSLDVLAATFTITALNPSTTQEPTSSMTPNTTPATFRITRNGGMMSGNTVAFMLEGTASASDYTLTYASNGAPVTLTGTNTGTLTFEMGQSQLDLTVTPYYGPEVEGDETVVLTLLDLNDPTYDITGNPSAEVTITDSPPPTFTVTKTGTDSNGHLTEGSMLTLDISSDATIDYYEVVWDYDPTTQTGSPPEIVYVYGGTQATVTHTYTDDNPTNTPSDNVQIRITAFQGTLAHQLAPVALTIDNVAPTWTTPPALDFTTTIPGQSVHLGALLLDPAFGHDIVEYTIDWGDGSPVDAATPYITSIDGWHTYANAGEYVVSLTATDDDGGEITWYGLVTVDDARPVISIPDAIVEGAPFTITIDSAVAAESYLISWGDGNTTLVAGPGTHHVESYAYRNNSPRGNGFPITVTAAVNGMAFQAVSRTAHVRNAAPLIAMRSLSINGVPRTAGGSRYSVAPGDVVRFEASVTDAGLDDGLNYSVGWGDGTTSSGTVAVAPDGTRTIDVSKTFEEDGEFEFSFVVEDEDGGVTSTGEEWTVAEDAEIGTVIGVVTPKGDLPSGIIEIRGWARGSNRGSEAYEIVVDPDGQILVSTSLDFESHPELTGAVIIEVWGPADDGEFGELLYSETQTLRVTVTDSENDDVFSEGPAHGAMLEGRNPEPVSVGTNLSTVHHPLDLFIAPILVGGEIEGIDVDLDDDGEWDLTLGWGEYDRTAKGFVVRDYTHSHLLGDAPDDGVYTARYRVNTASGEQFERDFEIVVTDLPAMVRVSNVFASDPTYDGGAGQPAELDRPFQMRFTAFDPEDDAITSMTVDWGDGTTDVVVGSQGVLSHVWNQVGEYYVSVTVDQEGEDGYLGFVQEVLELHWPSIGAASAYMHENGTATLEIEPLDQWGHPLVLPGQNVTWDLDGDGDFDDWAGTEVELPGNPVWLPEPIELGANPQYRARAKIVDPVSGKTSIWYFGFEALGEGPQPVHPIKETHPVHYAQKPGDFDVDLTMEIIQRLRPDVYDFFTRTNQFGHNNALVIEQIEAKSWVTGWWTFDIWATYKDYSGAPHPYIRLHRGMKPIEAAQAIIREAEKGYWRNEFQANKILASADAFENVEAFAKWQKYRRSEWASTTAEGAKVVLEWYSLQFGAGFEFVMTANDIFVERGPEWTDALYLLQALPFLSKLEIPITVKNKQGHVVATVQQTSQGLRVFGSAVSRVPTDYFDNVAVHAAGTKRTLLGQVGEDMCAHSTLQMLFSDAKIDRQYWKIWREAGTKEIWQIGDAARDTLRAAGKFSEALEVKSTSTWSWKQLVDRVTSTKAPAIIGLELKHPTDPTAVTRHAVVFDEVIEKAGVVLGIIRDSATGQVLEVPVRELEKCYNKAGTRSCLLPASLFR